MPKQVFKTYRPKRRDIQAVVLDKDNVQAAAEWCGGEVVEDAKPGDPTDVHIYILVPNVSGHGIKASLGSVLFKDTSNRFNIMEKQVFERDYERSMRVEFQNGGEIPFSQVVNSIPPAGISPIVSETLKQGRRYLR